MKEAVTNFKNATYDLLEQLPNFLKIKKITNPTTEKTLEVVDKRPCVIGLVLNHDASKALFVKQFRAGCETLMNECPAGVIDEGETPSEAMVRELHEECGINPKYIDCIEHTDTYYSSVGWTNERCYLYLIYLKEDFIHEEQNLDEDELLSYRWLPFDEYIIHELWPIGPKPIKSAMLVEMTLQRMKTTKGAKEAAPTQRICIFGGAFNPVTNLHMSMAERVIEEFGIDEFIFEPVNDSYEKADLASAEDRRTMLKKAVEFAENNKLRVGSYEANEIVQPTTAQTLDHYDTQHPGAEIYCVVGSDNLKNMSSWLSGEDILRNYHVVCIQREGDDNIYQDIIIKDPLLSRYSHKIKIIYENSTNNISSTKVRSLIKAGKSIQWMVPKPVVQYIKKANLYK